MQLLYTKRKCRNHGFLLAFFGDFLSLLKESYPSETKEERAVGDKKKLLAEVTPVPSKEPLPPPPAYTVTGTFRKGAISMPKIYLSPSTQEYNPYVTGAGSEEYFMNLLADAMEPILLLNGIQFSRNTPDMTAALLHPAGQRRTVRLLSGPPLQCLRPRCRGPEPGHPRLLLSHQRQRPPGGGAVRGEPPGHLPPAGEGVHTGHHLSGRGTPAPVPLGAVGAWLPR